MLVSPDDSFSRLMSRLRTGEADAARAVFDRFARRLIGLARRQFDERLRYKVDPEDVVQSAYKSFFLLMDNDKASPATWDGLWGLLTLITLRKCSDRVRYFRAERRDAAREAAHQAEDDLTPLFDAISREPSPDEAVVLSETVERLVRGLDEDERPIIEMSLQGYSTQEISEQLGRAERSVRRLRERVRMQLERMHDEGTM
jgi:RNA polymerase sigma-70 factor (ECF subfamily)